MTTKQKAKELIEKYDLILEDLSIYYDVRKNFVYKITLLAIDEIILSRKNDSQFDDTLWAGGSDMYTMHPMYLNYWQEVKNEIEKIKNEK